MLGGLWPAPRQRNGNLTLVPLIAHFICAGILAVLTSSPLGSFGLLAPFQPTADSYPNASDRTANCCQQSGDNSRVHGVVVQNLNMRQADRKDHRPVTADFAADEL
jgi:hypothetical protein